MRLGSPNKQWGWNGGIEESPIHQEPIRTYMEDGHLVRVYAPGYAVGYIPDQPAYVEAGISAGESHVDAPQK